MIRTYSELRRFDDFLDRYKYLALRGGVGVSTFGYDRYINQQFYTSRQWRNLRHHIITRDIGCDLGINGYEIHSGLIVHHMNPMRATDIAHGETSILDPAATKGVLAKGARNVEILKQGQFSPLRVEQQVAIIYLGSKGLLTNVPVNKVVEFEKEYLNYLESKHQNILGELKKGNLSDEVTTTLENVCKELSAKYN